MACTAHTDTIVLPTFFHRCKHCTWFRVSTRLAMSFHRASENCSRCRCDRRKTQGTPGHGGGRGFRFHVQGPLSLLFTPCKRSVLMESISFQPNKKLFWKPFLKNLCARFQIPSPGKKIKCDGHLDLILHHTNTPTARRYAQHSCVQMEHTYTAAGIFVRAYQ